VEFANEFHKFKQAKFVDKKCPLTNFFSPSLSHYYIKNILKIRANETSVLDLLQTQV